MLNEDMITRKLDSIEFAIGILNKEKDNLESELIDYQEYEP